MSYSIRRYRDSDAEALSALSLAAIRVVGSHGYSDIQIAAWAGRHGGPAMYQERSAQGHMIFLAVDQNDAPVAYSLLEPNGQRDRLYCHPQHTRKGLAERVLQAAENEARALGLTRLYTEASELARPAFERAGYRVTHRRDFTIEHEGRDVAIHNYAMETRLN